MPTKVCYECKVPKDLAKYHIDRSRPDEHKAICIECASVKNKKYHTDNRSKIKSRKSTYYSENIDSLRDKGKRYSKANKAIIAAKSSRRAACKLTAIPVWANQEVIKIIYKEARARSEVEAIKYQVDHIVPLKSKIVCGLHCEHNLQVIPAKDNLTKSNCYWPDMPY